jgi:hypothetical protein
MERAFQRRICKGTGFFRLRICKVVEVSGRGVEPSGKVGCHASAIRFDNHRRVLVSIDALAFFVVPIGHPGFCQLGEVAPCFGHLQKPCLVAIVCGRLGHFEAISGIAPVPLK